MRYFELPAHRPRCVPPRLAETGVAARLESHAV